jgi:hypothetical protein
VSRPIGPTAPTIGRIVHVVLRPLVVPAIVTALLDSAGDTIACTAFPPGSPPVPVEVSHDEHPTAPAGTWHWPPIR